MQSCSEQNIAMNLKELTLTQARTQLLAGVFSATEYVDALLSVAPDATGLNAFVSRNADLMRQTASAQDQSGAVRDVRQSLAGLPIALKDNINTVDLPTTGCTAALKGKTPRANAHVAQALFDAGAILAGKNNMHELAFGITSNNACTGAVKNPWQSTMIAGGSSGGSAAAVASRQVPAALGTDTGASVRLPAALCGVVGFRPTVGRYSQHGILPISHTRDTAGPIARSVADVQLLDRVLCGHTQTSADGSLRGLRIGLPKTGFFADLDASLARVVERALDRLSAAGVQWVEGEVADLAALNAAVGFPVALYEVLQDLPAYLKDSGYAVNLSELVAGIQSPDVAGLMQSLLADGAVPQSAYQDALKSRVKLQQSYARYFADLRVDAMLFPTSPLPARALGEDETVLLGGQRVPTFHTYIRHTDPGSNAGIPGISLPAGLTTEGLPVGLELDGPAGSDARLLALAQAFEAALGPMPAPPGNFS